MSAKVIFFLFRIEELVEATYKADESVKKRKGRPQRRPEKWLSSTQCRV